MWARGTEIEWAVALIKMDGILSGPGDDLRGREETRSITLLQYPRSREALQNREKWRLVVVKKSAV